MMDAEDRMWAELCLLKIASSDRKSFIDLGDKCIADAFFQSSVFPPIQLFFAIRDSL
jgi:hypothetical protein